MRLMVTVGVRVRVRVGVRLGVRVRVTWHAAVHRPAVYHPSEHDEPHGLGQFERGELCGAAEG